ncbi:MAG: NADP-dependent malic enzyme [Lachnospiraceae bacterium]|nr:NADP-dependent malic enzyme [Lachnospiraceae bacterium]
MDAKELSLKKHYEWNGKIEVVSRCKVESMEDLAVAYTPGVAQPCLAIAENKDLSYQLTRRSNLVAVVTDGSAVLGLGNIGPEAGMPVMEGKCVLFKEFGDVDAFPICIDSQDVDTIVDTVALISKSFGGINLEDIAAPRCFEIEEKLKQRCDIPVFHDDQHGTAIVVAAALLNAMKVTGRKMGSARIVINGAGAAGTAIAKLLLQMNFGSITMCDRYGIVCSGEDWLTDAQEELAQVTNLEHQKGLLADAVKGADIFVGVSRPGMLTTEMVKTMAKDSIVLAMANPTPEIMPENAKKGGAKVVGTGRSDFPNQINNVLIFPGLFKGVLSVRAKQITEEMKISAAYALAQIVSEEELSPEYIIPNALNKEVAKKVAEAVAKTAVDAMK